MQRPLHRASAPCPAPCPARPAFGRVVAFRLSWLLLALAGCVSAGEERWRLYNDDGIQLFGRGDYRNALDSFDAALIQHPHDPVLIYNAAQCYDRLGDVRKSEAYYVACLQLDAKHADARLALTALLQRTGRVNEASQRIQDWLVQEPKSADPYVADAWRLRQERNYPAAQGRLQQALALDLNNRRALIELAILYEIMGMPERSIVLYESILLREPNQVEISERLTQLKARGVKAPLPN